MKKKKINYFFEKKLNLFFFISFIFIFIFALYKIQYDLIEFNIFFEFNLKNFFFMLILSVLILSITSYRYFYFLKKLTKYSPNYNNWCKLFFQTLLINLIIQGPGHLLRAIKLKKENVNYPLFIYINYAMFLLILIFNLFLFLFFFYLITKKKIIILIFLILVGITSILTNQKFYNFLIKIFKKKLKFLNNKYKNKIEKFLISNNNFFLKKNLLIFFLFTLSIFFLELLSFNLIISKFTYLFKDIYYYTMIFVFIFYLNKIPFLTNFVGLNEILAGLFLEKLGLNFVDGFLIQLAYRVFFLIGAVICNILYYLINLKKVS